MNMLGMQMPYDITIDHTFQYFSIFSDNIVLFYLLGKTAWTRCGSEKNIETKYSQPRGVH